jgi:hypothetical protein
MNIVQEPKQIVEDAISEIDIRLAQSNEYLSNGLYDKACSCLKETLLMGERELEVYSQLGYVNYCRHDFHVALECYQMALDICQDNAALLNNLGLLYVAMGQLDAAENYFLQARQFPETCLDASLNLAKLSLATENYDTGWEYFCSQIDLTESNKSAEISLEDKTVLVYGHLDRWQELFYLRFLPELRKNGAKVVSYYPNEELQLLLRKGVDGIELLKSFPNDVNYDLTLSITELPRILHQSTKLSFLKPLPFSPPPVFNTKVVNNLLPHNGLENIGITWESCSPECKDLKMRVSPELLGESLRYTNANIMVLQQNASSSDIRLLEKGLRRKVFNYGFMNESVENTMAFLSELDHYISIGESNVHLAASINKKVSIMVSNPAPWQWLLAGKETPWFPGFNLYRQEVSGSWDQACHDLSKSLCC